jgi:hypothetical protein
MNEIAEKKISVHAEPVEVFPVVFQQSAREKIRLWCAILIARGI